ncbi:MAG: nucleotidyltransferase domain-containing protein [bacterium]|nr:nucleotidyltransferase domain-containing protein [bacterium]
MPSTLTILHELKCLLQEHFHHVIQDVILFGSQARGTANEDSDYDVLIGVNGDYDWRMRDKITDIAYDLELKYDVCFDKHLISTDELHNSIRGVQPVFVDAIQHGVYA